MTDKRPAPTDPLPPLTIADGDLTIHAAFDEGALHDPERVALVGGGRQLTYGELRLRSQELAHRLIGTGVGSGSVVGLYADRSPDLVVAMLGVLKAGAAYLPLSPQYPHERVRLLLADSAAAAVVTTAELAGGAPVDGLPLLTVDAHLALRAEGSTADRNRPEAPAATGGDAAYLIYTSGSTGRPKGVVITHRNLLGLVRGQDYANFAPDETFLQLAPPAFDASAFEIWGALLSGARLVVAAPSYPAVDELPSVLRAHGVTTLFLTPALFHELVHARIAAFDGLRRVIVGGDVLSVERARQFLEYAAGHGGTELVNIYGPTETTTLVTHHTVRPEDTRGPSIPLGRPINGVRLHVVDEDLRPVPDGETGEICIAGRSVARGYVGRPDLTERSFVPDPFAAEPGARMYRTGDLGLRRPDGTLVFVGRADDQVKIRGFRIEPKEVEQALLALPRVRDAAVVAEPGDAGGKRLSAHVVPEPGESLTPEEIRSKLRSRLPDYMIPSLVRCVDALPRTGSGKIDRNALRDAPLPTPADAGPVTAASAADGLTGDRKVLAEVWAEILDVAEVGPDDDFFALGGDSIQAIRAIALAESRGVAMSLSDLFDCPTIDGVCPPGAEAATTAPAPAPPRPVTEPGGREQLPEGVTEAYPATMLQLGLVFEAAEHPSLYHDVVSHRVCAPFDQEALEAALRTLAIRHPVLRTRFDLGGADRPMQLVESAPRIPLTVRDVREADADARQRVVEDQIREAGLPFDVEEGPLLRVSVARLTATEFQLTYGFHHAAMDGWSESVFLTELVTAYESGLDGAAPAPDPRPTTGFREFVALEDEALRSAETREFWLRRCKDLGTVPTTDAPRSAERHRTALVLPGDLRGALEERGRELRVPFKSLLVAAHLAALAQLTGEPAPVTGLAVNGRPETADAERLVGLFLNIVPVSLDVSTATWADLAQEAARAERAVLPHRRYPYQALRELAGGPLFTTVFNYVRFHLQSELAGARTVRVRESRLFDKASHPLMVDLAQDPVHGTLTLYTTGDTALWEPRALEDVCELHHRLLRSLADDPAAVPPLG